MKRKLLFICAFLFSAFTLMQAGSFYFNTSKKQGETISLRCTFTGKLIVKGVYGNIESGKQAVLKVRKTGEQISIQGAITHINLSGCALTNFGTGNNAEIEELWLTKNKLTHFNGDSPKGCPNLSSVAIYANQFTKNGCYDLALYLPDRTGKTPGKFYIYSEDLGDQNKFNSAVAHILRYKNWQVISYRRGGPSEGTVEKPIDICFKSGMKSGQMMQLKMVFPNENKEDIMLFNYLSGSVVNGVGFYNVVGSGSSSITLDGVMELNLNPGDGINQPVVEISEIQSPALKEFYFRKTGVKSVDLSKCPKLFRVGCYGNGMTAAELLGIVKTLPTTKSGYLDIYSDAAENHNQWDNEVIREANKRGWNVYGKYSGKWKVLKEENPEDFYTISFHTDKKVGETISIWTAYRSGPGLILNGLDGAPTNNGWTKYKLTSQNPSIRGAVTQFSIVEEKVNSLELEANSTLKSLIFSNNLLDDGLDLSGQKALVDVRCEGNGIKLQAMAQFIDFLPNRSEEAEKGEIRIISTHESIGNKNEWDPYNIMSAARSGWYVTEYLNGDEPQHVILPGSISVTTGKAAGSTLKIFAQYFLPIVSEGLDGTVNNESWSSPKLTQSKVTLSGSLYVLRISDSEITEVDMHRNEVISSILFDGNELQSLDVTNCRALTTIDISRNHIAGKNMTYFMNSLPTIPDGKKGKLTLSGVDKKAEGNKWMTEDLAIATGKGWNVVDDDNNPIMEGNVTGIESVLRPDVVDTSVYTMDGIRLATPIDELPDGVYIIGGRKQVVNRSSLR